MYKFNVLLLIFGMSFFGSAQDTLSINKDEILERLSNNLQLKAAEHQIALANSDYNQSTALFLPSLKASHTALTTTNPLMAFGSKLNQERISMADFNPELLNNPAQVQNYATRIELLQPILNMDGYYQRKAAKIQVEAYTLQKSRTKDYLLFETQKAYMQLQMAYQALKVIEKAKETTASNLNLVNNYYNQGMLQKPDLLAMQVRMNEVDNQIIMAKSQIKYLSDYIRLLVNDHEQVVYKPTETLDLLPLKSYQDTDLNRNREDIKAYDLSVEAYENMHKSSKLNLLPRINAFGIYELYDTKIFQFGASGYTLGAQLSWDIFDGNKSLATIKKNKVQVDLQRTEVQQYVSQSQLELNKAKRDFIDAENSLHLAKSALEQSKEALRIRQNRMEQGLEKTSDLLMSETLVAQKELEYLQAVLQLNVNQQYLEFLTQ